MRVRFSLLTLLVTVGVVGVTIGLMLLFIRQEGELARQRVMVEQARADRARAEAVLFAAFARQIRNHAESDDKSADAAGEEAAERSEGRQPAELERLRRENTGLRARVRELERALKVNGASEEPPAEPVP